MPWSCLNNSANGEEQDNDPPPFEIIHFTEEESEGYPVKRWLIDLFVFAIFITIGFGLTLPFFLGVRPSDSGDLTFIQFLASISLAVGLIPLLQFLGFDVLARFLYHKEPGRGYGTACSNLFKEFFEEWCRAWGSVIKALCNCIRDWICLSFNNDLHSQLHLHLHIHSHRRMVHGTLIIIVSIGLIIAACFLGLNPGEPWYLETGKAFIEAGLITGVTRFFFFFPNEREEREKLEKQVKDLESSMARGLADGYFWNFVKVVAENIIDNVTYESNDGGIDNPIDIQPFLIIVPREIPDWSKHPTKYFKTNNTEFFYEAKIKKGDPIEEKRVLYNITSTGLRIIIDMPDTINALILKIETETETDTHIREKSFRDEVRKFTERNAQQVKKQKLQDKVVVVEVKNLQSSITNIEYIRDAAAAHALQAAVEVTEVNVNVTDVAAITKAVSAVAHLASTTPAPVPAKIATNAVTAATEAVATKAVSLSNIIDEAATIARNIPLVRRDNQVVEAVNVVTSEDQGLKIAVQKLKSAVQRLESAVQRLQPAESV